MKVRLGKVMLTPAGEYSSSKTYSRLDIVVKDDCAYVSLTDNNANHPLTDENYWMLLLDGGFTRRYYEQNGITVASIICNGNATIGGNLTINGSIISPDLQARLNTLTNYINNNTSRINALNSRMTTAENNIANLYGGGGGGGGGGIDPATLAQLRSEINAKVDISYLNRLFQAFNGTTPVFPNDSTTSIDNIKALYDFWSAGSVTALGYNSGGSGGGGGGGVEYLSLLSDVSLSNPSNGQALVYDSTTSTWKNGNVVPDLTGYATQSWVTTQLGNYYTKQQTDTAIATAVEDATGVDLSNYYTKNEVYNRSEADTTFLSLTGGTVSGRVQFGSGRYNYIEADTDDEYIVISGSERIDLYNDTDVDGRVTADSFKVRGGTSSQFLKADGSVDPYTYVHAADSRGRQIHLTYEVDEDTFYISLNDGETGHITFTSGTTDIGPSSIVTSNISTNSISATGGTIQIGNGALVWDSTNNAIKVQKADGTSCDFYSTGGVSAYGTGSSSPQPAGVAGKVYTIGGNDSDTIFCEGTAISGFSALLENETFQSVILYNNDVYRLRAISNTISSNIELSQATRLFFSASYIGTQQLYTKDIRIALTSNDGYSITITSQNINLPTFNFNSSTSTLDIET